MLTVFSGENGYPLSNDDYYVRELSSGLDELVFQMSLRDPMYKHIVEEARIRDRDENIYIIKQIDAGNEQVKVVAQIDIDDFKSIMYEKYSNNSATVNQTVLSVLPSGWACIDHSNVTIRRTIPTSDTTTDYNVTAWKVLQDCCNVYGVRFRFNSADKIVTIINPKSYENMGAFATRDLNLRELNYKGKSTDLCTRLYAEGADGLTFAELNGGKNYVEDFTYTNKVISAYWKDERYTDAQSLLDDARAKLAENAIPQRSYDCDVLDLASTNPEIYGFENFSLFNVITLIDDAAERRLDYQIVERWNYPYYPVKNKVVLSTATPKIQNQVIQLIDAVNNATSPFQMMLQSAIANSTALITGNHGGYVILHDSDGNGEPDEILIMDTPSIDTAVNVWRLNKNGFGFSSTGYDGTYGTAITADGSIVASFITSGLMRGDRIEAGTLEASAFSVQAQKDLSQSHSYVPIDLFSNLSRWEYNAKPVGFEYWYENGVTTPTGKLILDGRDITTYNPNYQTQFKTDYVGKPTFTAFRFKFGFDRDVTVIDQPFVYFWFGDENGNGQLLSWGINNHWDWSGRSPKTYYADTEYTFEELNYTLLYKAGNGSAIKPRIGFRFVPNAEMWIKDLEVVGLQGDYISSTMEFTADGLNTSVSRGDIISSINQSAETVSIRASKINLSGDLSLRGDFHSYKPSDSTTYAFLDSGNLSFFNNGLNIFTVASTPLLGSKAGIFFGDSEDSAAMTRYTNINQDRVTSPQVYVRTDGRYDNWISSSYPLVVEGDAKMERIFLKTLTVQAVNDGWDSRIEGGVVFAPASYSTSSGRVTFESTVYNASGGTVFVSDKRKKKNIKNLVLDKAKAFIMALKPKEYKFKDGNSDRKHHGFIAQDVQKAMYEDWGLYVENTETDFIGLRYDEVIADLVAVVQDQEKRIEALERMLNDKSDV